MRLARLTANMASFHTVEFNPQGLTLIVGKSVRPRQTNDKGTYNGVGKSLLVRIIHFCLGCKGIKDFKTKLPKWEFTLEFVIDNERFFATRTTAKQSIIRLNGKEMSLDEFNQLLGEKIFFLNSLQDSHKPTFRALVNRFIRPVPFGYQQYKVYERRELEPIPTLCLTYLLGLDIASAQRKITLREEFQATKSASDSLKKSPLLLEYFAQNMPADIDIIDLEERIKQLEIQLSEYQIAEDYESIRDEANQLAAQIQEKHNQKVLINNALQSIQKSLALKPDVDSQRIIGLYTQAQMEIPEILKKRIEDIQLFHQRLVTDRIRRLYEEQKRFEQERSKIDQEMILLGKQKNQRMQYLGTHGAFEEYDALRSKLADLKVKLKKLQEYKELSDAHKARLSEVKLQLQKENLAALEHLRHDFHSIVDGNIKVFRSLAQEFYDNKPAGINVRVNEGDNMLRYDIEAEIRHDGSGGIQEVKIFCFDWTLLLQQYNHKMRFIVHDSPIVAEADPRQIAIMLKTAQRYATSGNFQYILTINEKDMQAATERMESLDIETIFNAKTIKIELTDESDEARLLGIDVHLNFET
jgi:uncharacterized protein YydD (DUF2326 family)